MKALALSLATVCCLVAQNIRVDLNQPGKKVSPTLFGLFVEEINHGGDGGIYNELVRNGSFVEAPTMDAWSTVPAPAGRGGGVSATRVNVFFDTTKPLNAVKVRSLRVEVTSNGEKAGVINEGYWGIAVKPGVTYEFATYARAAAGFNGPLTVSLEGPDGAIYGQTQISGLTQDWKRVTGSMQSNATHPTARLVISANRNATFWLNMVSLRAGKDMFRADLLQKLKDLKPAFVRFPGGTYVQGNDRETAYRWKKTIGDLEQRAGHFDAPWTYWSSDNLGYHEYLLLCEQLGAVPMYVAYAGMTWTPGTKSPFGVLLPTRQNVSDFPLDQMGEIVQDTLDAIEYANGPVTSTWGALRAKAGHPAPFGLKYIEIGNEDGGNPLYPERYRMMYDAIKARYPEIQVIANESRRPNTELPMDFVDEHLYTSPMTAVDFGKRLDSRDRNGPKAVLAEYAVQNSGGYGNMRAALAEAAMLGGIERNSDIMPMASYAPLLANVKAINWRPDLIYFDGVTSAGTPSYYVQKMFADSLLDTVAPLQVTAPELRLSVQGEIRAEGFNAQAEIQDAKTEGSGANYTWSARMRKTGGEGGLIVRFAMQDGGGSYLAWFLGVRHRASTLHVWGGGGMQDVPAHLLESSFGGALAPRVVGTIDTSRWYEVKIQVEGRRIRCFLDGNQVHEVTVPESLGPSLHASAGRTTDGKIVVRIVNASPVQQNVAIDLAGAAQAGYSVQGSELSSSDLDAENTVSNPTRIAPRELGALNIGPSFRWPVAGNSFTVLTLTPVRP